MKSYPPERVPRTDPKKRTITKKRIYPYADASAKNKTGAAPKAVPVLFLNSIFSCLQMGFILSSQLGCSQPWKFCFFKMQRSILADAACPYFLHKCIYAKHFHLSIRQLLEHIDGSVNLAALGTFPVTIALFRLFMQMHKLRPAAFRTYRRLRRPEPF